MKELTRAKKNLEYLFNRSTKPKLVVSPGEAFIVETEDPFGGSLSYRETNLEFKAKLESIALASHPMLGNPVNGPIYVEGARVGDLLEVVIERIEPEEMGYTAFSDLGERYLGNSVDWPELVGPCFKQIMHKKGSSGTTRDGIGVFDESIEWKLEPMIGTIGVAPEQEVVTSLFGHGPWGGNLDCRDIKEGTKVYINCYNDGGLLYFGDVHGSQSDTEFTGAADETRSELTIRCNIIRDKYIPFVRITTASSLIALYSAKPLEEAVEKAITLLLDWICSDYGFDRKKAYLLTGICPDFRVHVYQMAKGYDFTVGAELPKKYLRTNLNY